MTSKRMNVWIDGDLHFELKKLSNKKSKHRGKYVSVEQLADNAIKNFLEEENKK